MNLRPNQIHKAATTLILGAIACLSAPSQSQPQPKVPGFSHNVIVLDPAHGGTDTGTHLTDELNEKEVTLTFAATLRPLLTAAGFSVVATRDADPPETTPLTTDQRASTANHAHAIACLLIHATASGSGIHLSSSTLAEDSSDDPLALVPWESAQARYIRQSRQLANDLGVALIHAQVPTLLGRSSVRPLDNLTCPAVAVEIAPLLVPGSDNTPVSDSAYQQRIAQAILAALISWRTHINPLSVPTTPPVAKPATKAHTIPVPSDPGVKPAVEATPAVSKPAVPSATLQPETPAKPIPQSHAISKEAPSRITDETPSTTLDPGASR